MTLKSQPLTFLRPLGRGYNMGYAASRQKAHKALRLKGLCRAELMMDWHGNCFIQAAMLKSLQSPKFRPGKIPATLNIKRYSSGFRFDATLEINGDQIIRCSRRPNWSAARAKANTENLTWRVQISDSLVRTLADLLEKKIVVSKSGFLDVV